MPFNLYKVRFDARVVYPTFLRKIWATPYLLVDAIRIPSGGLSKILPFNQCLCQVRSDYQETTGQLTTFRYWTLKPFAGTDGRDIMFLQKYNLKHNLRAQLVRLPLFLQLPSQTVHTHRLRLRGNPPWKYHHAVLADTTSLPHWL